MMNNEIQMVIPYIHKFIQTKIKISLETAVILLTDLGNLHYQQCPSLGCSISVKLLTLIVSLQNQSPRTANRAAFYTLLKMSDAIGWNV